MHLEQVVHSTTPCYFMPNDFVQVMLISELNKKQCNLVSSFFFPLPFVNAAKVPGPKPVAPKIQLKMQRGG